jgi:hypothetical protein
VGVITESFISIALGYMLWHHCAVILNTVEHIGHYIRVQPLQSAIEKLNHHPGMYSATAITC